MNPLRFTRARLGFLEHAGTLSLARYPNRSPLLDWAKAIDLWSEGSGLLRRLNIPGLWSSMFVCDGPLPLHVDAVGEGVTTIGMIVSNEHVLHINTIDESIETGAGDIFAIDPVQQHGAETTGRFVFATRDLKGHELPTVEKARRLFLRDLSRVSDELRKAA